MRWKKAALENCPGVPCVILVVPSSPTSVVATAGDALASVAFTVPSSNGGSAITSYTVTSSPGGITATGGNSPINVTGLTNGTAYTIMVVATNAVGNSVPSAASTLVIPAAAFVCGTSSITDIDNNVYTTVLIGTQCWTKENLRVRRYNDGTDIRFDTSGGTTGDGIGHTWSGTGLSFGAYSLYAHDSTATPSSNLSNYGYLYNWFAAAGITTDGGTSTKNICTTGWHVPTDDEWTHLKDTLVVVAGTFMEGVVMKSTSSLWKSNLISVPGTNTSFFTALPGGLREDDGRFRRIIDRAYFWSSSVNINNSSDGRNRTLEHDRSDLQRSAVLKEFGQSIRCLKD